MKKILLVISFLLLASVGCTKQNISPEETSPPIETTVTGTITEMTSAESITTIITSSEHLENRIEGKFWCYEYAEKRYTEYENDKEFYRDYVPAITFSQDGTLVFRIHYGGGMADVKGEYVITENKIAIKLNLENSPFEGMIPDTNYTVPYMDDHYILEIIDSDTISFGVAPDAYYEIGCYGIRPGFIFTKTER